MEGQKPAWASSFLVTWSPSPQACKQCGLEHEMLSLAGHFPSYPPPLPAAQNFTFLHFEQAGLVRKMVYVPGWAWLVTWLIYLTTSESRFSTPCNPCRCASSGGWCTRWCAIGVGPARLTSILYNPPPPTPINSLISPSTAGLRAAGAGARDGVRAGPHGQRGQGAAPHRARPAGCGAGGVLFGTAVVPWSVFVFDAAGYCRLQAQQLIVCRA